MQERWSDEGPKAAFWITEGKASMVQAAPGSHHGLLLTL